MSSIADSALPEETATWCGRAEEAVERAPDACLPCAELVREGVLLRRRWDRVDPHAPARRQLLRLLPALQTIAQQRLAECVHESGPAPTEWVERVVRQLDDDDQYLAALLNDDTHAPESVAFAVECFRDDLHWLGTQVAVLDGSRGVDFLGRLLLEEEALEREIGSWDHERPSAPAGRRAICADPTGTAGKPPASEQAAGERRPQAGAAPPAPSDEATPSVVEQLRAAARQLRATALVRQIEALAEQPEPEDWQGWYRTWQAASRLATRLAPEPVPGDSEVLEPEPAGQVAWGDARQSVEEIRRRALAGWRQSLAELPPQERNAALEEVADQSVDAATETVTFLEDLPLSAAVRTLEILEDDVGACRQAVHEHGTLELRPLRRALGRQQAMIAGELQERRLAWRMESLFGHWFVAALERLILVLLLLFVGMLIAERPLLRYEAAHMDPQASIAGHGPVERVFAWTDLVICIVFLSEFCLKMALARRRWLYFRRNWFTGLLPSIPFGFLGYTVKQLTAAGRAEGLLLLRFLRYARLPRMARWLRIARPALRLMRVVGFLLRASDRLVRQLSPLLNRSLVLFERAAVSVPEPPYRTKLSALRERFYHRAIETIHGLAPPERCDLAKARIEDLTAMLSSPRVGLPAPIATAEGPAAAREIPLERIIARLLAATPAGISDRIGYGLAHSVTRWCRALDVFAVRRLPVVHDLVAASRLPSPYEATARVANRIGLSLEHLLDRVYWVADLYGTVTAPQLVDSVGEYMVKGAQRPARRLIMIGLAFLAVSYLARLMDATLLNRLSTTLSELVGWPLVVLGGLCMVPLLLGLRFRQIAGEAGEFYRRVAAAQFLTATKKLRRPWAEAQYAVLHRRVIAPELALAGQPESSPAAPPKTPSGPALTDQLRAAVEQLWEDYLDGPPLHSGDTATTSQLLGNLALVSLRETRLQYNRRRRKQVERLDLANTQLSLRGPYVWFHFISRSLAHHTAKLVENYNAFVLPLCRAETAEDRQVDRHVKWLQRRLGRSADQLDLAPEFRRRLETLAAPTRPAKDNGNRRGRSYQGNDFTAIHFLSDDPGLEADIRQRYGDLVADLMRRDRRDNIRRVFRTYPFHRWPKERRTFNPLPLYQRHLAGGRVLLLPLKLLGWAMVALVWGVRLVWSVVREVRDPSVRELSLLDDADPFEVARRKIHRMRKPVFMECLRMRAEFDPEYLGVVPAGVSAGAGEASTVQIDEDLARIGAEPTVRRRVRQMANQRRRQILEFRKWLDRFGGDRLSGHSLRAMAIAYTIDYHRVRSRLEAGGLVEQAFDEAIAEAPLPRAARSMPGGSLRSVWCGLRMRRKLNRLFRQPTFQRYDRSRQAFCRRSVCRRRGPLLASVKQLTGKAVSGDDPLSDAWKELLHVGRDPDTWTRQLVTLRAVQTLSVLNLDTYCKLVHQLGEYHTCSPNRTEGSVKGP